MAATETSTRANAALDDLYRHHVGEVYRYTYAVLGNHADAEDVTQTTFVNALRALERGESPHNASAWLVAIAQNIVRQRWRQAASRPTEVELVHDVPDTPADDGVEVDELVRALQRIPPAQREALVMRELEGRSYNEIAGLLGLTTSALETLLFRARRSLADELENLVTCQNAELAMSKQLDGRLSRKERRRLDEHLAECPDCAKLAEAQKRQRRAFKGLAVLPIPVGLALFKGAPSASAASLPTIGLASTGTTTNGAAGATGVGVGGASSGGAVAGGSLVAAAAKVAAVIVAATVAVGGAYKGVQLALDEPSQPAAGKAGQGKTPAAKAPILTAPVQIGQTTKSAATSTSTSRGGPTAPAVAHPGSRVLGEQIAVSDQVSSSEPGKGVASGDQASAPKTSPGASDSGPSPAPPTVAPEPKTPAAGPKPTPTPPAAKPKPTPAPPTAKPKPTPTPVPPAGPGGSGSPGATTPPAQPGGGSPGSGSTGASDPQGNAGQPGGGGQASAGGSSTPSSPPSEPSTPPAGDSSGGAPQGSDSGCPGGGDGPGNGSGCGVGNAYGQDKGKP